MAQSTILRSGLWAGLMLSGVFAPAWANETVAVPPAPPVVAADIAATDRVGASVPTGATTPLPPRPVPSASTQEPGTDRERPRRSRAARYGRDWPLDDIRTFSGPRDAYGGRWVYVRPAPRYRPRYASGGWSEAGPRNAQRWQPRPRYDDWDRDPYGDRPRPRWRASGWDGTVARVAP